MVCVRASANSVWAERRWSVFVFTEGFFEAEAVQQRDIVAGTAESGGGDAEEFLQLAVHLAARLIVFGDQPYPFAADLEEIEAYIEKL